MALHPDIGGHFEINGRVAVVTGAGSGLGQEAARIFVQAGATVVLADINAAGLEETAGMVREAGGTAVIQPTNVADADQVEALGQAALDQFGRLDIWVNAAGISIWSGVTEAPRDAVERIVAVNMMGTYWACVTAGKIMGERGGGSIINLSSTAGDSPVPGLSVYGMTKAGVNQLTRVCSLEFGPKAIRVNAVVPGWIDTPINSGPYRDAEGNIDPVKREQVLAEMAKLSPMGLTGRPVDIGLALLYLASDASRFVTGQMLRVSGGV